VNLTDDCTIVHAIAVPLDRRAGRLDMTGPLCDIARVVGSRCVDCPGEAVLYALWLSGSGPWGVIPSTICDQPCGRT